MYFTETATQRLGIMDVLNSQTLTNASVTSLGIDMSKVKRALFIVSLASTVAGTGTLDGRLQGSNNSNFTGNTNISGTNLTQMTTNNTIETVEIRSDQLVQATPAAQIASAPYRYVRLQLTDAVNAATLSMIGLGLDAEQNPASQYNLSTTFVVAGVVCNL